jgi:hypothetical protein
VKKTYDLSVLATQFCQFLKQYNAKHAEISIFYSEKIKNLYRERGHLFVVIARSEVLICKNRSIHFIYSRKMPQVLNLLGNALQKFHIFAHEIYWEINALENVQIFAHEISL